MKNTLLKIGVSVLPVEQELIELKGNEIYVVLSKPMLERVSFMQDLEAHPYRDEAYTIEGEWAGGEQTLSFLSVG